MALHSGERQVAPTVDGIRADHVARYRWALDRIGENKQVVDLGCGCGYGTAILAEGENAVLGVDNDAETIAYAIDNYSVTVGGKLPMPVVFHHGDLMATDPQEAGEPIDAAVAFEIIEHLADPRPLLESLPASRLFASVPNQTVYPYRDGIAGHYRHYTRLEFAELLRITGWNVVGWYSNGHDAPYTEVVEGTTGPQAWTLIVEAQRA